MCLLALLFRAVEDARVIVGANREEIFQRGGEPPALRDGPRRFLAGMDPVAGGTWLGVNERGLLVAVTNRPKSEPPRELRSRGLLARDLLRCPDAATAANLAANELGKNHYAGCNFLCADGDDALVIHAGDWLRVRPLPPGLHVVTAHDVNDASDRRIGHSLWWLGQRTFANADSCVGALKELCGQRGNGDPAICLRGEIGGTVSSSVVSLASNPARSAYWHAQGPPDCTPYMDYSPVLRSLLATSPA